MCWAEGTAEVDGSLFCHFLSFLPDWEAKIWDTARRSSWTVRMRWRGQGFLCLAISYSARHWAGFPLGAPPPTSSIPAPPPALFLTASVEMCRKRVKVWARPSDPDFLDWQATRVEKLCPGKLGEPHLASHREPQAWSSLTSYSRDLAPRQHMIVLKGDACPSFSF